MVQPEHQPEVLAALRGFGADVYDFRNPALGDTGFSWAEIDSMWRQWSPIDFVRGLSHSDAQAGFRSDHAALDWADMCVLLLEAGKSSHLEAGYSIGKGKPTCILVWDDEQIEPELMYLLAGNYPIEIGREDLYLWYELQKGRWLRKQRWWKDLWRWIARKQ